MLTNNTRSVTAFLLLDRFQPSSPLIHRQIIGEVLLLLKQTAKFIEVE